MEEDKQKFTIEVQLPDGTTIPITGTTYDTDGEADDSSESITDLYHQLEPFEFKAVSDSLKSRIERLSESIAQSINNQLQIPEETQQFFSELEKASPKLERNERVLLDAGFSDEELNDIPIGILLHTDLVAQQLQGVAGYGPVGPDLVKQIRNDAPANTSVRGQSVRVTAISSGLSVEQVKNIITGERSPTVDEAARLAIAYGITTGELLGIVSADEVRLLELWRNMDAAKREHLLGLLEP